MMRKLGLIAMAVTSLAAWATGQGKPPGDSPIEQILTNANGFTVDIDGAPQLSRNIRDVAIDELNIDIRETTSGLDVEYRTYSPGSAHFGSAHFRAACTRPAVKEARAWYMRTMQGEPRRVSVAVSILRKDGRPGRTYTMPDARLVEVSDCDDRSPDATLDLTVRPVRLVLEAAAETVLPLRVPSPWFTVEIPEAGRINPDDTWDLVVGGARSVEAPPLVLGRPDPATDINAHTTCTSLDLRGPMTDGRKALVSWVNGTMAGRRDHRTMTVRTPQGSAYVFADAFPVSYVFPHLSVTNTTGNVMEEVRIKPVRCELK